VFSHT